jgi:glutamyl-tRNA synthetase
MWEIGINRNAIDVSIETLSSFNKDLIDKDANRYFFVENPKKIKIVGNSLKETELHLHPDDHKKGVRKFKLDEEFYVQDETKKNIRYRLMGALDFMNGKFISVEKGSDVKMIHWLPANAKNVIVSILMEDNSVKKGLAEEGVSKLKEGDIIQFERFGFCILDNKKEMKFVFCHR